MKKIFWMVAGVALALSSVAATPAVAQADAVLLVAPARFPVMQVAFDVARRFPTILVSYQGSPDQPALHAWNGFEWMPLALVDYQSGAFLQAYPGRTIFLGDDGLLPTSLRSIHAWCAESTQIADLENVPMINAIGNYLPFTPADWRWFAGRYNLSLSNLKAEEAAAARRETWYSGSGAGTDPAPSFFKYFTRSRRHAAPAPARIQPVEAETP